jgi:hypothetical protein
VVALARPRRLHLFFAESYRLRVGAIIDVRELYEAAAEPGA